MNAIEVFLIIAGIICVIVSVVMNFSEQSEKTENIIPTDLTDEQKNKIKEIKTTVKDVNNAKKQVEKIHAEVKESDDIVVNVHDKTDNDAKTAYENDGYTDKDTKDTAKERLTALVKKNDDKIKSSDGRKKVNRQAEKLASEMSNNEKILKLNEKGITVKEIAKQLNLGIGEVKLVIDLYKGGK